MYRRNQRLNFDSSRCNYSKYLQSTTHSIHKNVKYLLSPAGQQSLLASVVRFECPFKKAKSEGVPRKTYQNRTVEDEFKDFKHFVDPEYKKYERFFDSHNPKGFASTNFTSTNVYNVSNDSTAASLKSKPDLPSKDFKETNQQEQTPEEKEDSAIDAVISQLAKIVGELEFQMGVESVMTENYDEAVDHFRLSSNHNHPGGIFNLALCYEQGVGVKKNMKTAKRLYEIASELGHAKAFYNLGVFYAQGLGGSNKSYRQAKKCFEKAAQLGNPDATQALSLLLPAAKKLPVIEEFPSEEYFFKDNKSSMMSNAVKAMSNQGMRRMAVGS